jgi:hypothetical protein
MWVYLCNFKVRVPGGGGGHLFNPKNIFFLEIFFFFNVNLSDHNKGKRNAIPIYSLIEYELPIWLDGSPICPEH